MEPLTYEALEHNPDLLRTLLQDARRERAEAVHRLISGAFRALFARPRRRPTRPALQPSPCG